MSNSHIPVLLSEMLNALNIRDQATYLDATFGGGGYSEAILKSADCQVFALDRDPEAIARGKLLEQKYPHRFRIFEGCFSDLFQLAATNFWEKFDGIVFDFGVSSFQIDQPERGFSFRFEGPLDMRMSSSGLSAAEVVNTFEEEDIANIIYRYGEERKSRRIANAIVRRRLEKPFTTTADLASLIEKILGRKFGAQHPATLTFQALRIFVNNELIEVESGLSFAELYLKPKGRLVTVTFHSLEDRIVKTFVRARTSRVKGQSRLLPGEMATNQPLFKDLFPKGIAPSDGEIEANPRSRSSRLRVVERLYVSEVES
ncbi:16S rRNA (cytosine(1402)-N(4))-methyltransferase RsmH [Candidatus Paracaedibacter symbiosus]|uniref:16S rRNA (cytosine(1402)-N(4))-methyltransferase RsmH n=1 Tax=Candidatus Paracaedibacter symbiosus TaxID=244582 RepID=UPI0005097C19|nr:16S rRNA (cytosine(1402)-N(4))-methyltransferase RsmH [Candidatus Paracaedibacter symbiosus]